MQTNIEGMLKIAVGVAGAIATVLIWWISRLLSDKKDIITNAVNIEHLEKEMKQLQIDVKENKKDFENYKDKKHENY